MAWVKVPPENHSKFYAALPKDPRVETTKMFGGIAAKLNGRIFAGLFGRSVMLLLPEVERAAVLALDGAGPFDPMGDGRARSEKVMLPESTMDAPHELKTWIRRAFESAARAPAKAPVKKAAPSAKPKKTGRTAHGERSQEIDAYLRKLKPDRRKALERLRTAIHSIVPKAEECISYQIPAFRLNGKVVAGFCATAKGCSYFPFSGTTLKTVAKDVRGYGGTKSALHFDPAKGLPATLVRKLLKARIAEG